MSNPAVMMYVPFALSGTRNTIQVTRQENQDPEDATLTSGFPDVTMIPESNGGIAPKGQDFNGIFYLITADTVHRQTGKRIQYDATYAKNINGYAKGAILQSTTLTKEYISTVDGNLTDPDSSQSSGWSVYAGAGSVPTATASISGTVKIVDNLVSSETDTALSANQGRILNEKITSLDFSFSNEENGSQSLPSKSQIKWGSYPIEAKVNADNTTTFVKFPEPFKNNCLQVVACHDDPTGANAVFSVGSKSKYGFWASSYKLQANGANQPVTAIFGVTTLRYIAIGY